MALAEPKRQWPAAGDGPLGSSRDIQGNILAKFNQAHQVFLFLNFNDDQDAARRWVQALTGTGRIADTKAVVDHNRSYREAKEAKERGEEPEDEPADRPWVALGLTSSGLVTLHPELAADLAPFEAFWHGPLVERRDAAGKPFAPFALIGDEAAWDAAAWAVGNPDQDPVDAILTIAADRPELLEEAAAEHRQDAKDLGLVVLKVGRGDDAPEQQRGDTIRDDDRRGIEHFGFRDGVSQPGIRGFTRGEVRNGRWEDADHRGSPIIATGEFVIGYPGERRPYAPSRVVDPPAWMRDGSFQVFLRLVQDVAGWNQQLGKLAEEPLTADDLGARLIGRHRSGEPLAEVRSEGELNDFDYAGDADGDRTPVYAHMRKVNPRHPEQFRDRSHRMLRRGIPFGPRQPAGGDDPKAEPVERGLLFNAFMASIEDQFEFVLRSWVGQPTFPPAAAGKDEPARADGPDPLLRAGAEPYLVVAGDEQRKLRVHQFVALTGAVYAFAPSLPALRRLARPDPIVRD